MKENKHVSVRLTLAPELRQTFHGRTRAWARPGVEPTEPSWRQGPARAPHIRECGAYPPISLYPRAVAGATSRFFLQLSVPLAAVAASKVGDVAFTVEDVCNPWLTLFPPFLLALYLNPVDLLKHDTPFCWNDK